MATADIYASAADAYLRSQNATYLTARSGGGTFLVETTGATGYVGQWTSYYVGVILLSFDLGAVIGAGYAISDVVLHTYLSLDSSTTDFVIESRLHDWGDAATSADWVAGADMASKTLFSQLNTSGIGATNSYKNHPIEAGLAATLDPTGILRLIMTSSRTRNGDQPSGDEYVGFRLSEQTGTSADPYITVTYAASGESAFVPAAMRHHFIPPLLGGH